MTGSNNIFDESTIRTFADAIDRNGGIPIAGIVQDFQNGAHQFDADGNGLISRSERQTFYDRLGQVNPDLSARVSERVETVLTRMGVDSLPIEAMARGLEAGLRIHDQDQNGALTTGELQPLVHNLQRSISELSK